MSFQWSFSTDKLFRRCQRQFFFREIAAHPNAKDGWRREAFILRQLKTLELWRGTLIHEGIEKFLVPALNAGGKLPWTAVIEKTLQRANDQLAFSAQQRYREAGITKGENDDFCALTQHETGVGVSTEEFEQVCKGIRTAFTRLAGLTELWDRFKDGVYWEAEVPIWVKLPEVSIKAQIDLLLERPGQRFTIIDWKSYEIGGDTDARLQTAIYGWALLRSGEHKVRNPESIELLECQVQEGLLVDHGFSQELVDTLDDYIYRSVQTIFSLCQSKKLADVQLQDFAFTDNPNNCDHCAFRKLCVERASSASSTETAVKPPRLKKQAIPSLF